MAVCGSGNGKVGVATATPTIRHSPPVPIAVLNIFHTFAESFGSSPVRSSDPTSNKLCNRVTATAAERKI